MTDTLATADLYDQYSDDLQVAAPVFQSFGLRSHFHGAIHSLKLHEDNTLVRAALETPGNKRVLVVDGGGSLRCALVGDLLAQLAIDNDWAGIIVNGCIRDSSTIDQMDVGIKALATHPAKSQKRGEGQEGIVVRFADATFIPNHFVYSDADGIVVSENALSL